MNPLYDHTLHHPLEDVGNTYKHYILPGVVNLTISKLQIDNGSNIHRIFSKMGSTVTEIFKIS